ncbi:class I SAM-dependent methyltransferase [Altererythrobacter lutimaris]|uniref:Class I SAM-dependent methyltransferase n=1 Tax=Altererythrobacter lutimaris TaxID=2743979 RepID=A0A850HA40_9SPHN|nr:class I SAM-dependent methyltransferase [Altererythrobacter lutimaris]NVE94589.1 class I SAM-dependent methyltransferase [Altererythrobacter lutimaris]
MAVGAFVRKCFGPYEPQISEAWRSMFVNLDDWTAQVQTLCPSPRRILEVGCGEGAMTERLAAAFPNAQIDAIDITPRLGRLFNGDGARVNFHEEYVEDRLAKNPEPYDLILLVDVLHHVPENAQGSLLASIRELLAPGGVFAMKDWERNYTPIYWFCYFADRFLTGDRIRYKTPDEAKEQLSEIFGKGQVNRGMHVKPWRTNYSLIATRA